MSVLIRFKKRGSKGKTIYKIVVTEKRSKRDGKTIAEIGYYNPLVKPPEVKFDHQVLTKWLEKGAKLSEGLKRIIKV